MIATDTRVETVSFYVNGSRETPEGREMQPVMNPATGAVLAHVPYAVEADIDRAVRSAHDAFLKWRDVPVVDRVQVLYRYKALLEQHAAGIAAILTRENGKTADDAKAEVRRMIQMVEVACGMPSLMMGDSLNDIAQGIDCKTVRQPIGVSVGITPFNFPAMVPMWMWPFALACGNTFVLKPSEKVPLTPTRAIELLHDAGLPAGVLNLVHGGKDAVNALLHHPLVRAVSFVGSTPVAKYIYTTAAAEGKRVQALGGAKNHLIVMPDADMPKTVEAIIGSAFGAAGERCLAGSVLVAVGDAAGPLLDLLVARTKGLAVGDGAQAGTEMGPLVTSDHCKRVEEIFGPVLSVIRVKDLDEAIALVNRSPFGNATAIFTSSGKAAREYSSRCEVGMVGVNVGVAAPMAFFPFAGWKNSFFGDLHAHGKDAVSFYTEQKVIMSRWF
jgi:malonate-semialdehyde dehydrogenase (acetylating)/methylmalonate-semialdehyde dehydrogenase